MTDLGMKIEKEDMKLRHHEKNYEKEKSTPDAPQGYCPSLLLSTEYTASSTPD